MLKELKRVDPWCSNYFKIGYPNMNLEPVDVQALIMKSDTPDILTQMNMRNQYQ